MANDISDTNNLLPPRRSPGRPRTHWYQIGLKVGPDLLARLDAWRRVEDPLITQPEAVRLLLDRALPKVVSAMPFAPCPLAVGDRVVGNLGTGIVVGVPRRKSESRLYRDQPDLVDGWVVEVQCDRAEFGIVMIDASALRTT